MKYRCRIDNTYIYINKLGIVRNNLPTIITFDCFDYIKNKCIAAFLFLLSMKNFNEKRHKGDETVVVGVIIYKASFENSKTETFSCIRKRVVVLMHSMRRICSMLIVCGVPCTAPNTNGAQLPPSLRHPSLFFPFKSLGPSLSFLVFLSLLFKYFHSVWKYKIPRLPTLRKTFVIEKLGNFLPQRVPDDFKHRTRPYLFSERARSYILELIFDLR